MPIASNSNIITSTGQISNNAVETADIKDANVTPAKLSAGSEGDVMTTASGVATWAAPASIPAGTVLPYAGSTAPSGYIFADGSSLLRAGTYATLFGIIGTTYGTVDGTHFTLPDLRGRVAVGKSVDTEFDVLGETGGEKTHQLSVAELPAHSHDLRGSNGAGSSTFNKSLARNDVATSGELTLPVGSDTAHNNLQPYITLNYMIKY